MTLTFRARDRTTVVARACFCLYAAVSAEKVTVLAGRTLGGIVRCACSSRGASSSRARADFCRTDTVARGSRRRRFVLRTRARGQR